MAFSVNKFIIFATLFEMMFLANCKPQTSNSTISYTEKNSEAKDLRYTFADGEEIPAGFRTNDDEPKYNSCKGTTNGICIPVGQCKPELKPTSGNSNDCDAGEECCFGGPPAETPCKNRGGECVEASRCGKNPAQLKSGTECDHANGETCCIWLY